MCINVREDSNNLFSILLKANSRLLRTGANARKELLDS